MIINGEPTTYFRMERGIRQGDLISPYLFIIMVEALGRSIKKEQAIKIVKGIKPTKQSSPIC